MVKEFLSINRAVNVGRSQLNYQKYMDKMETKLN